jgi:hypothetical protein
MVDIVRRNPRRHPRRRRGLDRDWNCGVQTTAELSSLALVRGEAVEPPGAAGVNERLLGAPLAEMRGIP